MIESMVLPENGQLLDLGCGYGPIGISASAFNPSLRVFMTDINKRAVKLAAINIERNRVSNVEARHGWLYEPVEGMVFDAVVSNPPLAAGFRKVIAPMIEEGYGHIKQGGSLQLVVRKSSGGRRIGDLMSEIFGGVEVAARGGGYRILLARRE